jgi:hypothetical protein
MKRDLATRELATSLGDVEIPLRLLDDPTAWINAETQQRRNALKADSSIFSEEQLANLTDALAYPVGHLILSMICVSDRVFSVCSHIPSHSLIYAPAQTTNRGRCQ